MVETGEMVREGGHGEEEGLDGEGDHGKGEEAEKEVPAVELAVEKTDAQAQVFLPFSLSPTPVPAPPFSHLYHALLSCAFEIVI